jgi:hypothetical protein
LYFAANNGLSGIELWTMTGGGAVSQVAEIRTISNVTLSADGVLELRFRDLGGRDGNFVVSGLEISVEALPAEAPLLAEGDPLDEGAAPVTLSLLQLVAAEASARWVAMGLTADQTAALSQVEFAVADLGAAYLGLADTTTKVVRIDDDAAGLGWSFEWSAVSGQRSAVTGPWSDGARSFLDPEPRPRGAGVDLLTVAMHEMGHLLGYEHREAGFMAPVLSAGRSSAGSSAEAVESLGRAEWRTGLSSFALSPSSRVDGVFTDLGHDDFEDADGSRHAAPSLLAPGGGKTLAAANVKASVETPQMRVPRRSRLPWIERELDTWFAELADAEERLDPKMQPDP